MVAVKAIASGWDQGSEARAWTSRTQSFSFRGHSNHSGPATEFSAEMVLVRLLSLQDQLGPKFSEELFSLRKERSPEIFFAGLLVLGQRLENAGKLESAAEVYSAISGFPAVGASAANHWRTVPLQVRAAAESRLRSLRGEGPFGLRFESLLRAFAAGATDPAALFAMGAAGASYKLVRLGVLSRLLASPARNFFTTGFGARGSAALLGFAVEAPTFTFAGKLGQEALGRTTAWHSGALFQELASSAIVLGSLKSVGFGASVGSRHLLKENASPLHGVAMKLFPQAGMLGGILLGHRIEESLGLRNRADGANTLADSLVTLLHFNIAGQLSRKAFGKTWESRERELDFTAGRIQKSPLTTGGLLTPIPIGARAKLPQQPPNEVKGLQSHMSPLEEGGSSSAEGLFEKFRLRFPVSRAPNYTEDILATVLRSRTIHPQQHERLLEALAGSPDAGSLRQFHRVLALEDVFAANALHSSTAGWDFAQWQLFLGEAIADADAVHRQRALQDFFDGMDRGLNRFQLTTLIRRHGYGSHLAAFPTPENQHFENFYLQHWPLASRSLSLPFARYPGEFRPMLLHFVFHYSQNHGVRAERVLEILSNGRNSGSYDPAIIDRVLNIAKQHRQGLLVLQRMFQVFAVNDLPSKLKEMVEESSWEHRIINPPREGEALELQAKQIDGTAATGYIADSAYARHLARLGAEFETWRRESKDREAQRKRFKKAFEDWAQSTRNLEPFHLFKFLAVNPTPDTQLMFAAWKLGKFSLEVLPDAEFDREVERVALRSPCNLSLFILGKPGQADRILIRQLPTVELSTPEDRKDAFYQVVQRLDGLNHEFDHWRRFRGSKTEDPREEIRIDLRNISREDRIKSEILAYMAEMSWRVRNLSSPFLEVVRLLNQPLPLYFRNIADTSYFSKENEERLAALREGNLI